MIYLILSYFCEPVDIFVAIKFMGQGIWFYSQLRWFYARSHLAEAISYARGWEGHREYHALDAFGASEGMALLDFTHTRI